MVVWSSGQMLTEAVRATLNNSTDVTPKTSRAGGAASPSPSMTRPSLPKLEAHEPGIRRQILPQLPAPTPCPTTAQDAYSKSKFAASSSASASSALATESGSRLILSAAPTGMLSRFTPAGARRAGTEPPRWLAAAKSSPEAT
eukprot:scaffold263057_cov32-Tisochrysis_lutea.AAC.2